MEGKETAPKSDFEVFRTNEFSHLTREVDKIRAKVAYIMGGMAVLIPLTIATLVLAATA